MGLIGHDIAAPKLKDAGLTGTRLSRAYLQCLGLMRTMFQKAKLVHADLSEYNILYYENSVWFIDVAQSVEDDHPHALEFLRMDCKNVTDFFVRTGVARPVWPKALFDFIVHPSIQEPDAFLLRLLSEAEQGPAYVPNTDSQSEIFNQVYIPRTLSEIPLIDVERDQQRAREGKLEMVCVCVRSLCVFACAQVR
jgi:RIO kinase 1